MLAFRRLFLRESKKVELLLAGTDSFLSPPKEKMQLKGPFRRAEQKRDGSFSVSSRRLESQVISDEQFARAFTYANDNNV